MVYAEKIPSADLRDMRDGNQTRFVEQLDSALSRIGFVALEGFDPRIKELQSAVEHRLKTFFAQPLDVKRQYQEGVDGQRGYTPPGREQSGYVLNEHAFYEHREHVFLGARFDAGHPIEHYQKFGYQRKNPALPSIPDLVSLTEELTGLLQREELLVYRGIEKALGLKHGELAAPHVYGNSAVRMHNYPKFPQEDILAETERGGFKTLRVRMPDGKIHDHLIRAAPHTDVDTSAILLGAQQAGLVIVIPGTNERVPFTAREGQIVFNGGNYISHVTAGHYPDPVHAVEMSRDMAKVDRLSLVYFSHQRIGFPLQPVGQFATEENLQKFPPTLEGVLLYKRLHELGYIPEEIRDMHIDTITNKIISDREFVERSVVWEAAQGAKLDPANNISRLFPQWTEEYLRKAG